MGNPHRGNELTARGKRSDAGWNMSQPILLSSMQRQKRIASTRDNDVVEGRG